MPFRAAGQAVRPDNAAQVAPVVAPAGYAGPLRRQIAPVRCVERLRRIPDRG